MHTLCEAGCSLDSLRMENVGPVIALNPATLSLLKKLRRLEAQMPSRTRSFPFKTAKSWTELSIRKKRWVLKAEWNFLLSTASSLEEISKSIFASTAIQPDRGSAMDDSGISLVRVGMN